MHDQCEINPWMVTQQQPALLQPQTLKRPLPVRVEREIDVPALVPWEIAILLDTLLLFDASQTAGHWTGPPSYSTIRRRVPIAEIQVMVPRWCWVLPLTQFESLVWGHTGTKMTAIEVGPESKSSTLITLTEACPTMINSAEDVPALRLEACEDRHEMEDHEEVMMPTDL